MITALDSRVMDRNAAALGVPTDVLMENAGKAVAGLVMERYPGARVCIFCGRGNNGGDGLVAAYHLENARIVMVDGRDMNSPAAANAAERVRGRMEDFTGDESGFDVLVDAGLGIGPRGTLRPKWREYAEFCNSFEGIIISVDVPSGFGTDLQVVPDITVTMVDSKEGMDEGSCGEIVIADIGMPDDAVNRTGPGDLLRYPVRPRDAHKGNCGRLLIVGGGPYYGAPAMAALAAMRTGTDMVYAAVPARIGPVVAGCVPETVVEELPGDILRTADVERILDLAEKCDAILIGPGLGTDPDTAGAVREIVSRTDIPLVADADAIGALGGTEIRLRGNILLTPHLGELRKLGASGREDAGSIASRLGCWILLKGAEDVITDGDSVFVNGTGTPAMTSAGTGDVLAGTAAGLLSMGMRVSDAARLAAYVVGKAGEYAELNFGNGLRATDLPDLIAAVIRAGTDAP